MDNHQDLNEVAVIIAGSLTAVELRCKQCSKNMYFPSMHQLRYEHMMYNHHGHCAQQGDQEIIFIEPADHDTWKESYFDNRWKAIIRACKKADKKMSRKSIAEELIVKPVRSMFKNISF